MMVTTKITFMHLKLNCMICPQKSKFNYSTFLEIIIVYDYCF